MHGSSDLAPRRSGVGYRVSAFSRGRFRAAQTTTTPNAKAETLPRRPLPRRGGVPACGVFQRVQKQSKHKERKEVSGEERSALSTNRHEATHQIDHDNILIYHIYTCIQRFTCKLREIQIHAQLPPGCRSKRRAARLTAQTAARSSVKARIMLRAMRFGMSALLSGVAPVFGEVSLVRSHSVMAARS